MSLLLYFSFCLHDTPLWIHFLLWKLYLLKACFRCIFESIRHFWIYFVQWWLCGIKTYLFPLMIAILKYARWDQSFQLNCPSFSAFASIALGKSIIIERRSSSETRIGSFWTGGAAFCLSNSTFFLNNKMEAHLITIRIYLQVTEDNIQFFFDIWVLEVIPKKFWIIKTPADQIGFVDFKTVDFINFTRLSLNRVNLNLNTML